MNIIDETTKLQEIIEKHSSSKENLVIVELAQRIQNLLILVQTRDIQLENRDKKIEKLKSDYNELLFINRNARDTLNKLYEVDEKNNEWIEKYEKK